MNALNLLPSAGHPPIFGVLFADVANIPWVALIAIIGGLFVISLVGTVAIIFGLKHSQRQQELWHETARIALEKGQPLPPLPEAMMVETKPESRSNDVRAGLVLIGVGGGLYLFFVAMNLHFLRFVGAIPGFIGVALLLFALGGMIFGSRNDSTPRS